MPKILNRFIINKIKPSYKAGNIFYFIQGHQWNPTYARSYTAQSASNFTACGKAVFKIFSIMFS